MKASKAQIGQIVDQPSDDIRFFLFWGPDEGQSRALAKRLLQALGADRFIVISGAVKNDPAILADEAGAMALFGGRRVIWVEPAGDEIATGIEALLEATATESPVVAIAPSAARPNALIKIADSSRAAVSFAAYPPEGGDAVRMVVDLGRRFGLQLSNDVAALLAASCNNDQGIIAQELEKLALFVDASPNQPRALDPEALEAVGANLEGDDLFHLADLALSGDVRQLAQALASLNGDSEAIPVLRALQRRLAQLAPIRAKVDQGERPGAIVTSLGKALFWRDKRLFGQLVRRWSSQDLRRISDRAAALERELTFGNSPTAEALGEELVAISRASQRR